LKFSKDPRFSQKQNSRRFQSARRNSAGRSAESMELWSLHSSAKLGRRSFTNLPAQQPPI